MTTFNIIVIIVSIGIFFFGFIPWAIGVYTVFHWKQKPPEGNDDTNRINNIISWHIGTTRPEVMGKAWRLFQLDVFETLEAVQRDYERQLEDEKSKNEKRINLLHK